MRQRPERVGEAVKEVLSDLLRGLKDPRIGFASITGVEMSRDLRHAKIYVSVLGSPEEAAATMAGLENAKGYLRTEVGRRVRLFHTPELRFELDHSIEHGTRIAQILAHIQRGEGGSR